MPHAVRLSLLSSAKSQARLGNAKKLNSTVTWLALVFHPESYVSSRSRQFIQKSSSIQPAATRAKFFSCPHCFPVSKFVVPSHVYSQDLFPSSNRAEEKQGFTKECVIIRPRSSRRGKPEKQGKKRGKHKHFAERETRNEQKSIIHQQFKGETNHIICPDVTHSSQQYEDLTYREKKKVHTGQTPENKTQ
ncbi:hypothetical protein B0T22DRAFT_455774 [Podospora appendiculata]|uniref:Uncharacterized protein n=1 Tax=Podospora appendiculata TaxID=314037 RepID=A0AAE0XLN5_9PEZI|nr:hypothetical protein B0T22DRAFT_455774 [Podospora appendiculata]